MDEGSEYAPLTDERHGHAWERQAVYYVEEVRNRGIVYRWRHVLTGREKWLIFFGVAMTINSTIELVQHVWRLLGW